MVQTLLPARKTGASSKPPSGGNMGVYSLSSEAALKTANFRPRDRSLEGKKLHGEWIFAYLPDE